MTNNTHVGHVGNTLERQEGEGGGRLLLQQGEINSVIFEICNSLQYLSVTGADQVNLLLNLFFHRGFPRGQ